VTPRCCGAGPRICTGAVPRTEPSELWPGANPEPTRCDNAAVWGGILGGAVLAVLITWCIRADISRRGREGTDAEDLSWRARYDRHGRD
jgi:hypothetical protein